MTSLLRSSTMQFFKIIFPYPNANLILSKLAQLNKLHFVDQNPQALNQMKPFGKVLKKCDELEDKLHGIEAIMQKFDVDVVLESDLEVFFGELDKEMRDQGRTMHDSLIEKLDHVINKKYRGIKSISDNYFEVQEKIKSLVEHLDLLKLILKVIPKNFE